jgi:general secretion pathway protein M
MSLDRAMISRAAALGILVVIVALLWLGPVSAFLDRIGVDPQHLATAEATLARYCALTAAAPAGAEASGQAILLPELSDAQAVGLLQESLKAAALSARVEIEGLQVIQGDTLAGTARLGVRVRGHGDIAGIDRLLYAIEAARPLLYPDNLQIQARSLADAAAPPPLDFQLEISAFRRGAPS